jgi:SAM-dependent methyltransferase
MDLSQNASIRFAALATIFDSSTRRHVLERGLAPGWQCLDVGAGGGSIARWLSERVGPLGRVVATDIDTQFLEHLTIPNLEWRRHDITCDPLPQAAFDLIHTRMVLIHLPARDAVLDRLAVALKPGGWLLCEELDGLSAPPNPDVSPGEVVLKTHEAMGRLNDERRVDRRYGRLLFGRFRGLGLVDLGAEGRMFMVQSGSPVATLLRASYELRRSAMISAGYLTEEEFERDLARMGHGDFMMPSPMMWTTWGRRP